jgi:phospholipid transport system transporter-binding protein
VSVALPAKLNIPEARAALPVLQAQAAQGSGALVVDASTLVDFDSAAIAVLLALRRVAVGAGRAFSVRQAPQAMVELAGLYGVAELIDFTPAAAAAAT